MKKNIFALILTFSIFLLFLSCVYNLNAVIYPLKYYEEISINANKFNVELPLVFAIVKAESNFNPNAISKMGAVGLMQIMPKTACFIADKIGKKTNNLNLKDAKTNLCLGTAYVSYLQNKFNNLDVVICAYNAGEGEVLNWIDSNGKLKTIKFEETKSYLSKVKNAYAIYKEKLQYL